jgi:hypothetical protein
VTLGDSDLGTFTGTTIADNETIKGALQDLETAVEAGGGVKYHSRYDTEAETARSGATTTTEIYYTARPDGDGYAESEVDDGGLGAGEASRRRLYYSDKFDADPDTSGDWTLYATQPADDTAYATCKASLLAGLSDTDGTANTRGTLPVSLKMERTVVTPLLLDTYSGATAAYSVRLLRTAYSGNALRVREDSGNTETDIGFDSNGDLDTAAIASHCGSANGYVVTWYDQSGNAYDATRSTASEQPRIYDGSSVVTLNGKPRIDLYHPFTYFGLSASGLPSISCNNMSFFYVAQDTQPSGTFRRLYYYGNTQSLEQNAGTFYFRQGSWNAAASQDSDQHLFEQHGTSTANSGYVDGTQYSLVFSSAASLSPSQLDIGKGSTNSNAWYGTIQEFIVYAADNISNRTGINSNINTYFSIYP